MDPRPDSPPGGALPFLFPGNSEVWRREAGKLREKLGVDFLYALIPGRSLWWKPFSEWTDEDLANPENLSIYWDINSGTVTAAEGTHPREKMLTAEPFDDLVTRLIAQRNGG